MERAKTMDMITMSDLSINDRVKNASLTLNSGEVLGIIGPNGAGKSTLLKAIAGVEKFTGELYLKQRAFEDFTAKERARIVGYLPQTVNSVWSLKVEDIVTLGRIPWGDENRQMVQKAMDDAAISHFAKRDINELSGGERARVWLARVLAGEPQMLLADEPVSSLDIHYQIEVMELLKSFARQGNSVMVAIHDLSLAARYCDRLCLIKDGEVIKLGDPIDVLTEEILTDAFQVPVFADLQANPPVILPK